jgi:hypothetical protein
MKFTPGPGIGGHCLSGEEWVFIKDDTGIQTLTLRALAERLEQAHTPVLSEGADLRLYAPRGLEVLSFDPDNDGASFRPLQYVSQRRYTGRAVEIWDSGRRRLVVTDGHPMMVWCSDELSARRADG